LLFDEWSIGGLFWLVKKYFALDRNILHLASILHRKTGADDAILGGRWIGGRYFGKSARFFVESPGKRAFMSTIQPNLSSTPLFHDAFTY